MAQVKKEPVDVVIVGAGAAGSVYAALLAEAGKKVLVLEGGRERKLTDLYSSQVWARRLKWASPHVVEDGPDSIWYNFNAGHGTGGAAIHHYAVWPRFHEEDFRMRTLYGRGLDWPFEYSTLRPFYDAVQKDVGISGDAAQEKWRPEGDPYPLGPVMVSNHGKVLKRGFDKMGLHTSPIPMALLSAPYNGRQPCIWDGWCDAGCPIGALANPLVVYLPRAIKAGATVQNNAHVTRVLTSADGKRATAVEYYTPNGDQVTQPADAVVLCAFSVENVRIMLNSGSSAHANGLGNGSGLLGRYLMSHAACGISGLFKDEMQNFLGATGGQLICQDHFDKDPTKGGGFGSRQWEIALAVKPNDLLGLSMTRPDLFGEDLQKFMVDAAHHLGSMASVCEDEPLSTSRIERAPQKDKYGMALARVRYQRSAEGLKLWKASADEGIAIMKAAGAHAAWNGPVGGQHIMGGTILGNDPKRSVLNANAQSHEVNNLFVGGPGVFPTSSSVNSTYTLHAVAMKSARYMAETWGSFTGA